MKNSTQLYRVAAAMHSSPVPSKSTGQAGKTIEIIEGKWLHVPDVFLTLHEGSREGYFSVQLSRERGQARLLLALLALVIFSRFPLPGTALSRAQLRVAMLDGAVVGHTVLLHHRMGLEILLCAVSAKHRRRGIGMQLVEDAIQQADRATVNVACMPKAHSMCMLLRDMGFVETGRYLPYASASVVLRHWKHANSVSHGARAGFR